MFLNKQYIPSLVSVIIPAYNRGWSLQKTVQSVFRQDYRPIECIVIDDGSTDNTAEVMEKLNNEAPEGIELRYQRQTNGGANSARNHGLRLCRGEFICFLDSDDWLLPESVSARAEFLLHDSEVDFSYGLCSVQDEQGHELMQMNSPWPEDGQSRIAAYLFHTSSPLIRRRVCQLAGPWKLEDTHSQEYEYFARIKYFSKKVIYIDKVLSVYLRHHAGNIFDLKKRTFLLDIFRVLWMIKGLVLFSHHDNKLERQCLADEFHKIAKNFYRSKDYENTLLALRESLLLSWQWKRVLHCFALTCMCICRRNSLNLK